MYLEYIWTNRMKWILKKSKDKRCLLCSIARGKTKAKILKEGEFYVIMNNFPYTTGHLLIFPKKHVSSIEELNDEELMKLMKTIKFCIIKLKKCLKPKGFNIGCNIGKVAGASVKHLHFHIVPRFGSDAGFVEIVSSTKVMPEPIEKTYKKIKKYFRDSKP
ncbi:MAG: HIT domain-containing protein [Candidatus Aenigmatarchaeota archaeon]